MRNQLLLFSIVSIICAGTTSSAALASSLWESERALADKCDIDKRAEEALSHYRRAIKALPPTDLLNKADLQSQVVLQLIKLRRLPQARSEVELLVTQMKLLNGQHAVNDKVLYSLTSLSEEMDMRAQEGGISFADRKSLIAMLELIYLFCLPKYVHSDKICAEARVFLAFNDPGGAWHFMQRMIPTMRSAGQKRHEFDLRMAAAKKHDGKPEDFNRYFAEISKSQGLAQAVAELGEAQTWAADYDGCIATVKAASDALKKGNKLGNPEQLILTRTLVSNCMDRGAAAQGEKDCKTWLAIPGAGVSKDRELILSSLLICLKQQSKTAEIKKYEKLLKPDDQYDFITEDEKAAEQETLRRRSAGAKNGQR